MSDPSLHEKCRRLVIFLVCCLLPAILLPAAQETPDSVITPRRVVSFEHVNQELALKCDVGRLILKAYADNIIHVRYLPTAGKAIAPLGGINATPSAVKYRVDSTLAAIRLSTPQMTASVDRKTAQITFLDPKQNVLLTSKQYHLKNVKAAGADTYNIHAEFLAPDEEAYFGLGSQPDEWMNLPGKTIRLWHDFQKTEGNVVAIPFLITNRKYGMAFDNSSRTTVMPGNNGVTAWDSEAGQALSYFVISGETSDDIYRGYRQLTGGNSGDRLRNSRTPG
jgi:alpha-D-xyloside xylohydrolase